MRGATTKAKVRSGKAGVVERKRGPNGRSNTYELKLYVAGQTPKSLAALANLNRICNEHLKGKFKLEVIDLVKKPQLAHGDQILAIPTLVRKLPVPIRKIIGDLSDTQRVVVSLSLQDNGRGE
jgi:circadian clock protein KaiB